MKPSAQQFYQEKVNLYSSKLTRLTKKLKRFAGYRLAAFVLIVGAFFIPESPLWAKALFSGLALLLFLYLVKRNLKLEKERKKLTELLAISKNELLALDHEFAHFHHGNEFKDPDHNFSHDLDLFGEGSLFQFINRTVTQGGREKLANWLMYPSHSKVEIEDRQLAIKELTQIPTWRIHFMANGRLFEETRELSLEIRSWAELNMKLNNAGWVKGLTVLIPLLTLLSVVPTIMGYTNLFLLLMIFVQWFFVYLFWKKTTHYFKFFSRKSGLLEKYMELLKFVEAREFNASYLVDLQQNTRIPFSASQVFKQLKSRVKEIEYRQNMLVGLLLNSFLLWDVRCVYRLWKWHDKHHDKLAVWLDVMATFDALVSLANYADNHPEFAYPEIHEGGFRLKATAIGHPLIHPDKCISNDIEVNGWSKVVIITGANMAGKSTFLRTMGVNLVLGRTGAPVFAKEMNLTPISIYTHMRTTDSLVKDESYFFAELRRIKAILERLEKGEKIFIILDEMLKGTNSIDKLNGSRELIKKLIDLKSVALIATHDLKLSELEQEYPQQVFNKCFEIRIVNDELVFDYILSNGVTKTMNATFLMKKMGII